MTMISPAMARAGFLPASPPKGWRRADMARPKPAHPKREAILSYRERLACQVLNEMIQTGHVIATTEDGAAVISIEVDDRLLRALFMFDAEVEDMEPEHPDPADGGPWTVTDDDEEETDLDGTEDHGGSVHMTAAESREAHEQARELIGQARRQRASAS